MTWDERAKQILSNLRVVPRLMVILYGWLFWNVAEWYMAIPDPTTGQASFIATIVGGGAAIFGLYSNSSK